MSGRGRGRGRGRGPPSLSSEMLHNSAKESGMTIQQAMAARSRHGIYEDILLHSSGKKWDPEEHEKHAEDKKQIKMVEPQRTSATIYMIAKQRELHYRITNSPFHIKLGNHIPDVVRYNERDKIDAHKKNMLHSCFQGKYTKTSQGLLFPEELMNVVQPKSKHKKMKESYTNSSDDSALLGIITEEDLMKGITQKGDYDEDGVEKKNNADGDAEEVEWDDGGEEEEGEDYIMDYYASENEDDSLGEHEATY